MAIRFVDEHKLDVNEHPCTLIHDGEELACKMRRCPETGHIDILVDIDGFNVDLPVGEKVVLKFGDGSGSEYRGIIGKDYQLRTG